MKNTESYFEILFYIINNKIKYFCIGIDNYRYIGYNIYGKQIVRLNILIS